MESSLSNNQKNYEESEEEFQDYGYTSISQYNEAIDEIVKSVKYSPLERIYYEAQPPDQLKNEVSLRNKTQEHLRYIESKGVTQNDINVAKEIIRAREEVLGVGLDLKSFVLDTINQKGKSVTEEIFLGLVRIFELAGGDVADSEKVYIELFNGLYF